MVIKKTIKFKQTRDKRLQGYLLGNKKALISKSSSSYLLHKVRDLIDSKVLMVIMLMLTKVFQESNQLKKVKILTKRWEEMELKEE